MKSARPSAALNADEVKLALAMALRAAGLTVRTEYPLKGPYGRFPVDVAVFDDKQNVLCVAEAKCRAHDLRIQQRTNYSGCGYPAFLVHRKNLEIAAAAILSFVSEGILPTRELLIHATTWASNAMHNGRRAKQRFRGRFVRG